MTSRFHFNTRRSSVLMAGIAVLMTALAAVLSPACAPSPQVQEPAFQSSPSPIRFPLLREGEKFWLSNPAGERFFSLGINGANRGEPNDSPETRGYRGGSGYTNEMDWAEATARRLTDWGFTTVGGWSDWELLKRTSGTQLLHTPVLHVGHTAGAPWRDLWDPQWIEVMEEQANRRIQLPAERTPGRFQDNELGWWNGALFRETLGHPAGSAQRQRLIALLREIYRDDWSRLLLDFETGDLDSFAELERGGQLWLRPGGSGIKACRLFLAMIAQRYYQLTSRLLRDRDPGGLVFGDRYATSYYPELIIAAAAEVDVISTNLKAGWNDGSFPRFYLDTLHSLSGKPVIVSEIYMAAMENASGNLNRVGGFPLVDTQAERVQAVQLSLEQLARLPYVVGVDWFQFSDESPEGRYDGEDFNMGLVDIRGRPYDALVRSLVAMDLSAVHDSGRPDRANATHGVPVAPDNPAGHWKPREALRHWDRERGFVPARTAAPFADLYLAWNSNALWLGVYAMDMTENNYYRDRKLPEQDRMLWRVKLPGNAEEFTVRLGSSGFGTLVEHKTVNAALFHTLAYDTRAVAVLRISASQLGRSGFRSGDVIELESVLDSHARAERTSWKGSFTLD